MQITPDRLNEIKNLLSFWLDKKHTNLKELQSLLGKLNFASSTVRAGRVFVSRLLNTLRNFPIKGRKRLDRDMKKDILWWFQFMEEFDGITIIPKNRWEAPDTVISSDANLRECGGWSHNQCFTAKFPKWLTSRHDVHINELELITFVVSLKIWNENIQN